MTSLKELYEVISMGYSESYNNGREPEQYSLLPIARDVVYKDGKIRLTLIFFNDNQEVNMTMAFDLNDQLESDIDDLLGF